MTRPGLGIILRHRLAKRLPNGIQRTSHEDHSIALDRRVTMFVLFLTILAVGLIAITRLQLELFPKGFEGYSLSVRVPWRSAVPQEVMEKIAQPLEEELNTVRGSTR